MVEPQRWMSTASARPAAAAPRCRRRSPPALQMVIHSVMSFRDCQDMWDQALVLQAGAQQGGVTHCTSFEVLYPIAMCVLCKANSGVPCACLEFPEFALRLTKRSCSTCWMWVLPRPSVPLPRLTIELPRLQVMMRQLRKVQWSWKPSVPRHRPRCKRSAARGRRPRCPTRSSTRSRCGFPSP